MTGFFFPMSRCIIILFLWIEFLALFCSTLTDRDIDISSYLPFITSNAICLHENHQNITAIDNPHHLSISDLIPPMGSELGNSVTSMQIISSDYLIIDPLDHIIYCRFGDQSAFEVKGNLFIGTNNDTFVSCISPSHPPGKILLYLSLSSISDSSKSYFSANL